MKRAPRRSPLPGGRPPPRDQRESAFASILGELLGRLPGGRAAALVDFEGETVDYAGGLEPFAIRVCAAQLRVVFDEVAARPPLRGLRFVAVRASAASYLVHELPEGYALVVTFARAAAPFRWRRAVAACAWGLAREAGWKLEEPRLAWVPVDVLADARRRPAAIRLGGRLLPVEVLGSVVSMSASPAPGASTSAARAASVASATTATGRASHASVRSSGGTHGERGWRVRLETGIEATLVREPGGAWYSDEPPAVE